MTEIAEADEIESLRQQLEASHQTSDLNANALEETQAELIKLRQQLAECEQQRDSNYDEMQRAWAELKESIRERNAFQDQCISLKMKMTVMREERDELETALRDIRFNANCDGLKEFVFRANAALAKLGADKTATHPDGMTAEDDRAFNRQWDVK